MTIYNCKPCIYATYNKGEYLRHLQTKKHCTNCPGDVQKQSIKSPIQHTKKESSVKLYLCDECHEEFSSTSDLDAHYSQCEMKTLRAKNKELILLNEQKTSEIELLKDKNEKEIHFIKEKSRTEINVLKEKISKLEDESVGLSDENKNLQKEIREFMKKDP